MWAGCDVGLGCFVDTSEYNDCKGELDEVVYVEHEESDKDAEATNIRQDTILWH